MKGPQKYKVDPEAFRKLPEALRSELADELILSRGLLEASAELVDQKGWVKVGKSLEVMCLCDCPIVPINILVPVSSF